MNKRVTLVLIILLAVVFIGSGVYILSVTYRYREEERIYDEAAEAFLREAAAGEAGDAEKVVAPIQVDFAALREVCGDVVGWIYCEDTVINYPVVQGEDNDFYLHHSYEGTDSSSGAIFVDANNRRDFLDSNTIVYGHHMKNGSMFAGLDKWEDQEYYEEHPEMWLLTPEQDYRIILFSGYTTSAYSDAYRIITGPCEQLNEYLKIWYAQSDFQADVTLYSEQKYILLSTCAYEYNDARRVLHGMLVPVDSAGGVPIG